LIKGIINYNNLNNFYVTSFAVTCDTNSSNINYYGLDYNQWYIIKYDGNWNYLSKASVQYPKMMLIVSQNNTKNIFLATSYGGVYSLNENLTIFKTYAVNQFYSCLYYNITANHLLASTTSYAGIDVFYLNLTLIKTIPVSYSNNYIAEYNGLLYVSSTTSFIMVLKDEVEICTITTLCATINTISIDSFGIIAVNCPSYIQNNIYLYNSNGSYTGTTWISPVPTITKIGYDHMGNLIMAARYGLFFLSQTSQLHEITNPIGLSSNDVCIVKGIFNQE
jgi:hypothetical protein